MTITKTLIIQTAKAYSVDELQGLIKTNIEKLAENEIVINASTGAGASYAIKERNKITELIDLYSAALEYKTDGKLESANGCVPAFAPKMFI